MYIGRWIRFSRDSTPAVRRHRKNLSELPSLLWPIPLFLLVQAKSPTRLSKTMRSWDFSLPVRSRRVGRSRGNKRESNFSKVRVSIRIQARVHMYAPSISLIAHTRARVRTYASLRTRTYSRGSAHRCTGNACVCPSIRTCIYVRRGGSFSPARKLCLPPRTTANNKHWTNRSALRQRRRCRLVSWISLSSFPFRLEPSVDPFATPF